MARNFPRARYGLGGPTAISGDEYGLRRRFEALRNLTSLDGKMVLDVGCGLGAYSLYAKRHGAKVCVGLDINLEYVKKSKVCDDDKIPSIHPILADAHAIPFRDSCFDIVLMVEVLEHLSKEREALREARRVLKEGGLLLITVPNRFYPFETHGAKIGRVEIENLLGIGIPFLSWMPSFFRSRVERAKIYTQKQLIGLLREQGFLPLKLEYMMPPLEKIEQKQRNLTEAFRRLLLKLEASCLKYFACHILVLSRAMK